MSITAREAATPGAVHPWRFTTAEPGWLARLFDNKTFLVVLCLAPAVGLLVVFLTYPLGLGLWLAFTDTKIGRAGVFVGLENFDSLFHDRIFWLSVTNTLFYTAAATTGKFGLGLWLALLLNHNVPFKSLIRAIVLIPWIVPTVLSAIAFWWIYDPQFSIITYFLKALGIIDYNIDFLGTPWHARLSLVAANIWRGIPFVAISLLAGLQTISPSLYEAAMLDGAGLVGAVPVRDVADADAGAFGGTDLLGVVHVHRFSVGVCDHQGWPGERHSSNGDACVPARHPGRTVGGRGRDRDGDDPVPGCCDTVQLFRAGPTTLATR